MGPMVIQPLQRPLATYRPPASLPVSSSTPADSVELAQQPAPTPRQLLWTSLETAQVMSGSAVSGPLGKVLTQVQKDGVLEVLRGIEKQGGELQPERALGQILKSAPEFEEPLTVKFGGQSWQIRNLADLKDASSLTGAEPVQPAGPALQRLAQQGWQLQVRRSYAENEAATVLDAYRTVTRGQPHTSRGQEVKLKPPAGHEFAEDDMWAEAEVLPAVDFFYGSGSAEGLENPELARGLKALKQEGLKLTCWGSAHGLGERDEQPFSWYSAALRGNTVKLIEYKSEVAEINSFTPADLESLRDTHREWAQLDQTVLQPAVESGALKVSDVEDVVSEILRPVEGIGLEERATLFLSLVKADKKQDFYDTRRLYDDLVDLDLKGPQFRQEHERALQLSRAIGADSAREAIDFLRQELPKQVSFEPARQRSEQAFMKLVMDGAETALARKCLDLARTQVDGSPFEARLEQLSKLHRSGQRQEGYDGLADDYRAVLENRRSGENLSQAARPLLSLLDALSSMGKAELARETYVFIRQSLEYGTLAGSEEELVHRFLQTLVLRDSPEEARASLSRTQTQTAPGSIQETRENVKVGGVVVRRKKKNTASLMRRRKLQKARS